MKFSDRSWDRFKDDLSVEPERMVYGLVAEVPVATRIAHAAKICHVGVHNFDRAESLLAHLRQKIPVLVIVDLDHREAEAFKFLNEIRLAADLKGVPVIGYASQSKHLVHEEARRAGCHRVYTKTEFTRDLEVLLGRYVA